MKPRSKVILPLPLMATVAILITTGPAQAYVGPGLGLGTLAVIGGVIGSILLAIFAVLWYPMKRVLKKKKNPAQADISAQVPKE